jgi:hypothetical protein
MLKVIPAELKGGAGRGREKAASEQADGLKGVLGPGPAAGLRG